MEGETLRWPAGSGRATVAPTVRGGDGRARESGGSLPPAFLVAAGLAVAAVGLFATWIVLGIGDERTALAFDDIGTIVAAFAASSACAWAAWRRPRGARRAWVWLWAYTFLWAVGEATWGYYELVLNREVPFPSLADVGYLGAVPFGVVAVLSFRGAPSGAVSRVRTLLDGAIIAGSLLFVSWAFVLGPTFRSSSGDLLTQALSLAYPISDVVIGTAALAVLARSEPGTRGPLALVVFGLLATTIADGIYAYLVQIGAYGTTNLIDAVWIAGYALFALAAVLAITTPVRPGPDEALTPLTRVLVPYVALGAAGVAAVGVEVWRGGLGTFLFWSGLALVILVAWRQLLSFAENRRLNADLARTVESLRAREEDLEHLAFHDPLTRLANRALFRDRIVHAIARGAREGRSMAVLFIDLDDFKTVNDSLGHGAGDELLAMFAERLRACVRPGDTAARLGGDEFGVLLDNERFVERDAALVAQRILKSTRSSFGVGGRQLDVTASIGLCMGRAGIDAADDLLRKADLALYESKANGKNRYTVYEASMGSSALERLELRAALQQGIEEDQFRLVYQPIVRLDTDALIGFEALVRWHHPTHGLLSPPVFLPLAEETGLVIGLGRSVLAQACAQTHAWVARVGDPAAFRVHVNLSARELVHRTVVADIAAVLEATGADPRAMVLEITESAMIEDAELALDHLHALKALGFQIGLDDFGTGYSSLSYLQDLPIDVLKIDRSFVTHMDGSGGPEPLLAAIIQLGHALGIRSVAEGVETQEQLERLRELGCDAAQGYWLGRPLPANHAERVGGFRRLLTAAVGAAP